MDNPDFRKYLEEALGQDVACKAFSALGLPASVSVRYNPFKLAGSPHYAGHPVVWNRYGLVLDERPSFTLDPLFHGGAYYVQDSSSMFVGYVFRKVLSGMGTLERPLRVLDLCAAPGGKTTDLAASLREMCGDGFILVANEVVRQRASVLADNVAIWGDPNVVVTSADPEAFASLRGFFDIVLADVPCSGEGMFRKDEEAVRQWSAANVSLCQARQRRIVADVWPALADGGFMLYSTCTFNRYENDLNAIWASSELGARNIVPDIPDGTGAVRTDAGYSLVPGMVEGEGQYCALLEKRPCGDVFRYGRIPAVRPAAFQRRLEGLFDREVKLSSRGDMIVAVPSRIAADVQTVASSLRLLAGGCAVGTLKGDTLVPDPDLSLSLFLAQEAFPSAELTAGQALRFLHRDTIVLENCERGYVKVCYMGLPLGFVKNLGNRCNNLHPQNRRIRMSLDANIPD